MIRSTTVLLCCVVVHFLLTLSLAQQGPVAGQGAQVAYPASDEGLQQQLQDSVEAARSKDAAKEALLVRALIRVKDRIYEGSQPKLRTKQMKTQALL